MDVGIHPVVSRLECVVFLLCSSQAETEKRGLLFVILALILLKDGSIQEG